jgi:uncharacterized Zn-binding protein involved in type VI secretion
VLIGGQPAAVGGTEHTCALPPKAGPHPQTPLSMSKCSATVYIGGRPAARMGDSAECGATITQGAPNVLIGG